jgi:hypothetical protein
MSISYRDLLKMSFTLWIPLKERIWSGKEAQRQDYFMDIMSQQQLGLATELIFCVFFSVHMKKKRIP